MNHGLANLESCTFRAIESAENALRKIIEERYPSLNEEMITHLFWCELRLAVQRANDRGEWSNAFANDISAAFSYHVESWRIEPKVDGLFCEVQLHNKIKESKSGGDFGLFTTLPAIESSYSTSMALEVTLKDRAVLVQAKLRKDNGNFQGLTESQKRLLPVNDSYSHLLLYEYQDKERKCLQPFLWQSLNEASAATVASWLKKGKMPSAIDNRRLITQLFQRRIGTSDRAIIDQIIQTSDRPQIKMRFYWGHGEPRESTVRLCDFVQEQQPEFVRARW